MRGCRILLVSLVVAAGVAALAGCGSDEPVTVLEGEIPRSVPGDFPVPPGAAVGFSIVDRVNHRSEVVLTLTQEVDEVAEYFLVNLVSSGYVVGRSAGDGAGWVIEFSRGTLRGSIVVEPSGPSAVSARVAVNRS